MTRINFRPVVLALLCAAALAACGQSTTAVATQPRVDASLPLVVVHKSPACGCCEAWVTHMKSAGFPVEVKNVDNLDAIKTKVGVPYAKGSCHTAEVDGYFVEGHVPAADVKRLLAERPQAKGLTVPGMPAGSPGMETPDGTAQPYDVELVAADGTTTVFAHHPP
ncbi:MAG: DUF411 domain-containing protein [Steroidobacteraceae bacterium]